MGCIHSSLKNDSKYKIARTNPPTIYNTQNTEDTPINKIKSNKYTKYRYSYSIMDTKKLKQFEKEFGSFSDEPPSPVYCSKRERDE